MLKAKQIAITATVEARKEKIDAPAAWELLRQAEKIRICKGKKVFDFIPVDSNRQEILALALGRSQTLRAPTLRSGDTFIVGFNEEFYEKLWSL